jgi:siroheme synthase
MHVFGEQLAVLERAAKKEKLISRLKNGDRAASSELHALALCVPNDRVEIEIEPEIEVGGGPRVPDFRLRMSGEPWV